MLDRLPIECVRLVFEHLAETAGVPSDTSGRNHKGPSTDVWAITRICRKLRPVGKAAAYSGIAVADATWPKSPEKMDKLIDTLGNGAGHLVRTVVMFENCTAEEVELLDCALLRRYARILSACPLTSTLDLTIIGLLTMPMAEAIGRMKLQRLKFVHSPVLSRTANNVLYFRRAMSHVLNANAETLQYLKYGWSIVRPLTASPHFSQLRHVELSLDMDAPRLNLALDFMRHITPRINPETIRSLTLNNVATPETISVALRHIGPFLIHLKLTGRGMQPGAVQPSAAYEELATVFATCTKLNSISVFGCPWFGGRHLEALTAVQTVHLVNPRYLDPAFLVTRLRDDTWLPSLRKLQILWTPIDKAATNNLKESRLPLSEICQRRGIDLQNDIDGFYV